MFYRLIPWLESHWVAPAYSGGLMTGLALFFFSAATNTMAGWLYVISGIMLALLAIAAVLPVRSLRSIQVRRIPAAPVSVGELLTLEVRLENQSQQPKTLLLVQDGLPAGLGGLVKHAIESIAAGETYCWKHYPPTEKRGVYRWQTIQLRTATPLGLFWCQRQRSAQATAIVYPTVLPLSHCPLLQDIGLDPNRQQLSDRQTESATAGLTRTLRPYRWGDSVRLVHWRTSARYGELRIRELENYTGGQAIVIGLDSGTIWQADAFEQAVVAAVSLYFYARHHQMQVSLWTATSGQVQGDRAVLEALAAVEFAESDQLPDLSSHLSLIWLSQNQQRFLSSGSRWVLWRSLDQPLLKLPLMPNLIIHPDQPLQSQLQASLSSF